MYTTAASSMRVSASEARGFLVAALSLSQMGFILEHLAEENREYLNIRHQLSDEKIREDFRGQIEACFKKLDGLDDKIKGIDNKVRLRTSQPAVSGQHMN